MTAKSAIRRQLHAFLQSEKSGTSSNGWVASVAVLASAAAAASVAAISRDDDSEHHLAACVYYPGAVGAPLPPPPITQRTVQCEALHPDQRRSRRSNDDVGGDAASRPWQAVTSSASRKSLLHHRHPKHDRGMNVDMHEKYNIEYSTVLGEGVSSCLIQASQFFDW